MSLIETDLRREEGKIADIPLLNQACSRMRRNMIEMTYAQGSTGGHIGGSLSLTEIMAALYLSVLNLKGVDADFEHRDRVILSKGHGVIAQYAAMAEAGILSITQLESFKKNGSELPAHPCMNDGISIDFSSGSLGQGLSLGVGTALGLNMKGNDSSKVYVVIGDGECDEGQIWESAMTAAHYNLSNLVCIVDCNGLQYDGDTAEVKRKDNLVGIFTAFGWNCAQCDGHDVEALIRALADNPCDGPYAIIANTVKGKGVSFMEGNAAYHNNSLSEALYLQAIEELELQ